LGKLYRRANASGLWKEKAQIGILNAGHSYRRSPCGSLRFEHLERTIGFPTQVAYVKLTGEDLSERSLSTQLLGSGGWSFPSARGIKFDFDRVSWLGICLRHPGSKRIELGGILQE